MGSVLIEVGSIKVANDGVNEYDIVVENNDKKVILDPAEHGPWLVKYPGSGDETIWFII